MTCPRSQSWKMAVIFYLNFCVNHSILNGRWASFQLWLKVSHLLPQAVCLKRVPGSFMMTPVLSQRNSMVGFSLCLKGLWFLWWEWRDHSGLSRKQSTFLFKDLYARHLWCTQLFLNFTFYKFSFLPPLKSFFFCPLRDLIFRDITRVSFLLSFV